MPHAFALNHIHIIFSTRGRRKTLTLAIQPTMWAYIRGITRNYEIDLIAIGGMEDHVHLLVKLPPKLSLANTVRAIKANSSKWMNENGHRFAWQQGYAAFSVSVSRLEAVTEYIRRQPEHHKRQTFEQELEAFFQKHGLHFDPAAVLD